MQMNRITEAKFLLQAVSTATKNRKMDDSFVKSFERASQMLVEIESSSLVDPIKEKGDGFKETQRSLLSHTSMNSKESNNSGSAGQHLSRNWDIESRESFGQNSLENKKTTFSVRSMSQCSPQSWPADEVKKIKNIENSGGTYEVEVCHARRRLYESPDPARKDQKVPYTKPKRCSWGFNNGCQRETRGDVYSDSKPSSWSPHNDKYDIMLPKSTENGLSTPANGRWRASKLDGAKEYATSVDKDQNHQGSQISLSSSAVHKSSGNDKISEKKSWADIVEEEENEEQDLFYGRYTNFDSQDSAEVFNDENENSNIIYQRPWLHSQTECLSKKLESFDQKDGHDASGNASLSIRNKAVRRSLCFDPELTPPSTHFMCTSNSPKKASNLESQRMLAKERDSLSCENKLTRRNRLQVFQDITETQ